VLSESPHSKTFFHTTEIQVECQLCKIFLKYPIRRNMEGRVVDTQEKCESVGQTKEKRREERRKSFGSEIVNIDLARYFMLMSDVTQWTKVSENT
jgi:hypothetical protein